ncbi:MAG: class I SAM-dependent methyltransferase [Clostridia bacterium]|nr:class I SAM-dependent methyltransferase [Clostridia bacterium]
MKKTDGFGIIAAKYDIYNSADYDAYVSFVLKAFEEADIPVTEVLDLGCGTGELSVRLADAGKSVTAADISEDMLSVLVSKSAGRDIQPVRQDMRGLDLFGTVQGCVSAFDCLNYLLTAKDLEKAMSSVGFFMEKGGVFVFDVNTEYAYSCIYDGKSYVYETEDSMLVWQSGYDANTRRCRFYLTSFDETEGGLYSRRDCVHAQKFHPHRTISAAAKRAGFDILGVYGTPGFTAPEKTSAKNYYVLKKNRSL